MSDVPGVNERMPQRPISVNQVGDMAKAMGLTEDAQVLAKEVAGLLGSQASVRVTNTAAPAATAEVGTATGATGVPALDNPDDPNQKAVDLEKLISYLQLENDKHQAELAKERIELQKGEMDQRHAEQMGKIKESLEQMDKAAKANLATKIFGWLMAAASVAVAIAACVATGGLALGAVIGAGIAVGMCILNETGAMDKITEALADALKDAGMSEQAAQIVAAVIIAVAMIAISLGAGFGGNAAAQGFAKGASQAVASTTMTMAKNAQSIAQLAAAGLGVGTTVAGGVASAMNYKSGELKAETTEMEKFLAVMKQQLEESQEELEKILGQIQNIYSDIASIINSAIDTETEIAHKMGQMA